MPCIPGVRTEEGAVAKARNNEEKGKKSLRKIGRVGSGGRPDPGSRDRQLTGGMGQKGCEN